MKFFTSTLLLLLLFPGVGHAQKKFTNVERANKLRSQYEDTKTVAFNSSSSYEFKVQGENLEVVQTDKIDLISLESNVRYNRRVFYNDHSSVKGSQVRYTSGKGSIRETVVCGNYEIEDIFYSDAKVCSYQFNILYEASEVTFTSEKHYKDPKYLTKVFFHDQDPAEIRKISFIVPKSVNVDFVEMNFSGFDISKKEVTENHKTIYTYTIKKIKALKNESHSLGVLHYYPHIVIVTKGYKHQDGEKVVLSSIDDLYGWYFDLVKEVRNDPEIFRPQVERLIEGAKTPEDKIKAIYYWVQDNIKYIAFEDGIAGFKPDAAQNVFNNRYGDCKGMAILTKEMLKLAGFDARLTWIGTNRIPYDYDLPSLSVDNHMICTVFEGDLKYILDPTEKYIALGDQSERIQGKEMLIENGDNYIRKKVPVENSDKNLVSRVENIKLEDETLKGKGELTINGEAKKNILFLSTNSKVENRENLFDYLAVSKYNNDDMVKVTETSQVDREMPLTVHYEYALNNKVNSFEKDLYIELDWNKTYGNLIMDEDREADYYFGRKIVTQITKKLQLPSGYKINHLPQNMSESNGNYSFQVSFRRLGNEIVYENEIIVANGIIVKDEFDSWNKCITRLKAIYDDQIVLTKIR